MNRQQALMQAVAEYDDGTFQADLARRVAFRTESEEAGQAARSTPICATTWRRCWPAWALPVASTTTGRRRPAHPGGAAHRRPGPAHRAAVWTRRRGARQRARWDAGRDPWTLRVEGDRWYGRGTADNKGQHSINSGRAAPGHRARGGRLGFNAVWLIETGEEAGSPGLAAFCEARRDELAADVFLASDGPRLHAERPTLFMGSRGAVNFELSPRARARLSLGQLGRAAVQPRHRAGPRHRHAGGRARPHHGARPASAAHPAGGGRGPGRAGRGRRRGRSRHRRALASPACRPRKRCSAGTAWTC